MKKLTMFLIMFALMFIGFAAATNVTYAAETTETVTTEETTTGEEISEDDLNIQIGDDGAVYIDGVKLTKEQLLMITYEALEENFGSEIATALIVIVISILSLLGVGTWGITRLAQNIRASKEVKRTYDNVVEVGKNVDSNTDAVKKLESRVAKSQAIESLLLEGLNIIIANSTNQVILGSATSYKEKIDKVLSIDDNLVEALSKVEEASKNIKNTAVGETAKQIKAAKKKIINSMIDEE